jgi:type I restriction enzyme R subunit
VAPDDRLPELPGHYGPFVRLVLDEVAGNRTITQREHEALVELAVEATDSVVDAVRDVPNFWRPSRVPDQDKLASAIFERVMLSRLMADGGAANALVDKLMELARANHDRLMKA